MLTVIYEAKRQKGEKDKKRYQEYLNKFQKIKKEEEKK